MLKPSGSSWFSVFVCRFSLLSSMADSNRPVFRPLFSESELFFLQHYANHLTKASISCSLSINLKVERPAMWSGHLCLGLHFTCLSTMFILITLFPFRSSFWVMIWLDRIELVPSNRSLLTTAASLTPDTNSLTLTAGQLLYLNICWHYKGSTEFDELKLDGCSSLSIFYLPWVFKFNLNIIIQI